MQKKFRVLLPGEWQLSNLQQQEWPLFAVKASVSQLAIRETCSQKTIFRITVKLGCNDHVLQRIYGFD